MRDDTIAAIATSASSAGGIGVVRVSGDRCEEICRLLFRPRRAVDHFESHRLYHGDIIDPGNNLVIDEGLAALMRGPRSYTGEDVLEISCHGNPLILRAVLDLALKAGARVAEPGEFTRRAFLNGRIDLAQAEAVADLVAARTERGLRQALSTLKGGLSHAIESIRSALLEVLAVLETSIDFTEEDIVLPSPETCEVHLDEAATALAELLGTYDRGVLCRDGITAVIAGRPNVGKSSLLNRMAGEQRAIVAAEPGTTRDYIEAEVRIGDLAVRFVDTAGIRDSSDDIEREGVRYARQRADEADLVLVVLDGSKDFHGDDGDIIRSFSSKQVIVLVNKCDLPRRLDPEDVRKVLPGCDPVFVSAREGLGMDELRERIRSECDADESGRSDVALTNLRHREALQEVEQCVRRATVNLQEGASPELPALELSEALRHLGIITGEEAGDDLLDIIFSRFCVGK